MTELKSASFMPFGVGNRQCIGNRLAVVEMKMTFISTLKAFTIEKNEQTPVSNFKAQRSYCLLHGSRQTIMQYILVFAIASIIFIILYGFLHNGFQ